jgi:DNA polymerase-3 subunit epsilon
MDFILFADTETTGMLDFHIPAEHPTQPRIASIAGILCSADNLAVVGSYFTYVINDGWSMPQGDLPNGKPSAGKINGITDAFLQQVGMPIQNVMETFADFLSLGVTLVTHNVEFDYKMIRGELRRLGMDDHYRQTTTFCTLLSNTGICKIPAPRPGKGKYKWPSLIEAYQHWFKEEPKGQHNAYGDAIACMKIYKAMRAAGIDLTPKEPKKEGDATMAPRPAPREGAAGKPAPAASSPQPASAPNGAPAGEPTSIENTSFI